MAQHAVEAARVGGLDAWWAGLPADVRAGFMGLLALCRV